MNTENETYELTDLYREIAECGAYSLSAKAARFSAISECLRDARETRSNSPQEVHPYFDQLIAIFEKRIKDGVKERDGLFSSI